MYMIVPEITKVHLIDTKKRMIIDDTIGPLYNSEECKIYNLEVFGSKQFLVNSQFNLIFQIKINDKKKIEHQSLWLA